ncbi:glucose ABC transporter ATP-binding protein GlcV [Acidianus sp. RZ1]|uniref:glucose ABC transporter ATP-binding protein GlcV n=1 Tax=Acidianus sp. RZ1 TaxID=1540082 RepID=UPI001491FF78|nr:glucose ABC transporter ATP-binding protein GlcV [Acidianus sp. RZ1]NON61545.1 ABC transporter ATP-binding protein [Acidianus sp. RZ1]
MVEISAKSVYKIFSKKKGEVYALKDINLTIESGEKFGILGPSGAGKTTFMRIIAGLEAPTKGELLFDEKVVARNGKVIVGPESRNIGMVFQNWSLYPNMTAFDNIAFPLTNMKISKSEMRQKVEEVAKVLEISSVLEHYPRELSGGQQQRVALARAIVKSPSVLLLDEPFSNLDARIRDSARALVRDIAEKLRLTVIVVSHDPADIFSISNRVGVIFQGELVQVGKPEEIYNSPKSFHVARLIGEINELKGKVIEEDGKNILSIGNLAIPISGQYKGEVKVGIRPENLRLEEEPREEGWVEAGKVRVKITTYEGGHFKVTLTPLGDDQEIIVFMDKIPKEEEMKLFVRPSKIMFF